MAKYPSAKYGPGYNAEFYATVFELLLRLRANYIWPAGADWGQTFFVDDPRNQPLADEFGIVMGTSHTGVGPIRERAVAVECQQSVHYTVHARGCATFTTV